MIRDFFLLLRNLNDHYSQLALVVLAFVSAIVAYNSFVANRRPYVMPEVNFRAEAGTWYFDAILVNKGERPGIAKITSAILKIGDESYPTVSQVDGIVLSPDERQTIFPVGHINEIGRRRIIGHEYHENRVEIELEIMSRAIGDKSFLYKTKMVYKIDVSGATPVIQLIESNIN